MSSATSPDLPELSQHGRGLPEVARGLALLRRRGALTVISLAAGFPTATWGRDELGAGEMWNSNSLVSWLLSRSGFDLDAVRPPRGGRAPGWTAGIAVARREARKVAT